MDTRLPFGAVVQIALPCLALALAPACSGGSAGARTQTSHNPQSPGGGGGDDGAGSAGAGAVGITDGGSSDGSDGSADALDGPILTVPCGQSIAEWCCTYPGSVCWPHWTSAAACLSPQLSVTTMPGPCGGFNAVRQDVNGGFIYTIYDATTGAFAAQGAERQGTFGCFGGPTPFSILASCMATWDAVPSAPCTADAGEGGAPAIGPWTYCDGGAWSP
jgi:hypothetical protein